MNRGYVRLWRKAQDSGLLQNADIWQVFSYLLLNASHKEYKMLVGTTPVHLKPGQLVTGRNKLAQILCSTQRKVRTALVTLQNMGIIDQQTTNKFTIISIINWHIYQQQENANDQQNDQRPTSARPAGDQHPTTNNNIEHKTKEDLKEGEKEKAPPKAATPQLDDFEPSIVEFVRNFQQRAKAIGGKTAPDVTNPLLVKGCQEVERTMRLGKFSLEQIKGACYWALDDKFWSINMRALSTMRKPNKNGLQKFQNVYADWEKSKSRASPGHPRKPEFDPNDYPSGVTKLSEIEL